MKLPHLSWNQPGYKMLVHIGIHSHHGIVDKIHVRKFYRMNLVIIYEEELAGDGIAVICDPRRVSHIQGVLRALPGNQIKVGLLNGRIGEGKILSSTPEKIELRVEL